MGERQAREKLFLAMATHDHVAAEELELDFLSMKTRDVVVGSPLHKEFLLQSFDCRLGQVASDHKLNACPEDLKVKVQELLKVSPDDQRLLSAAAWRSASPQAEKTAYVVEKPERFQHLKSWCPESRFRHVRTFTDPDGNFKEMDFADFKFCVQALAASPSHARVTSPVAKV